MKSIYHSQVAVQNVVQTPVTNQEGLKKLLLLLAALLLLTMPGVSQDYTFVRSIGSAGTGEGQFANPRAIALDAAHNLYATDYANHRVQVFDTDGDFVRQFGTDGSGNGQFHYPNAIMIDAADNLYVGDYNGVQVFNSSGTFLRRAYTQFVSGLAMDQAGNIYIGTAFAIHVYNNALTQEIRTIGEYGKGTGQFDNCRQVKVDKAGRLFAADLFNNRVQIFNSEGAYIGQIGSKGSGDGQFQSPTGLAFDGSGFIYVTDEGANRVQVFDPETFTMVRKFGTTGTNPKQFQGPQGILLDNTGNIYIAEYFNNRIQVFSKTPEAIHTTTAITKVYDDPDFALSATSDSQRPVQFSEVEDQNHTGDITINSTEAGNTVSIVKAGNVKIRAFVSDDYNYSASFQDITLTINKAPQNITFDPLEPLILGENNFILLANASSLLPVEFSSSDPDVASIEGDVVTIKSAGTTMITARQPGNENYEAAPIVEHELVVDAVTGVDPQTEAVTEIFPIPAHDLVTIRSRFVTPATRIVILDSFGHTLEELKTSSTEEHTVQVSVKHLPTGMYYLQVTTPRTITQRIVKN